MADLHADLKELQELAAQCQRPRVKALLDEQVQRLEALATEKAQGAASRAPAAPSKPPAAAASTPSAAAASKPPAPKPAPKPAPPPPAPVKLPTAADGSGATVTYTPISSFGWDQDEYGKDPQNVYVYITTGMDGVGECKERATCDFSKRGFDVKIHGFNGKNYRLVKDTLDKEIVPESCKMLVKKNSVKIVLRKVKGQYGYDSWHELTAKRSKADESGKEKDPSDSIMDMMKTMYDEGDDTMKKTLGEAMLKSRQDQMRGGTGAGGLDGVDGM